VLHYTETDRPEYFRMTQKAQEFKPDIAVLCTGYKQEFPFLGPEYPTAFEANVRNIWHRDDPTVGFIGFIRPALGAIPPLSEMQAQLWVLSLLSPERLTHALVPNDEGHYRLLADKGARVQYGVDHESYVFQLGLDMSSAPTFTDSLKVGLQEWAQEWWTGKDQIGWRLPLVWAFGTNFNTKFRLCGPWKWDGAPSTMASDELWDTVARRNLLFGKW
jgi:dimethylaniline monooxygenase (N-oxide forming)